MLSLKSHYARCPFWKNHHEYNRLLTVQFPWYTATPMRMETRALVPSDLHLWPEGSIKTQILPLVSVIYASTGRTQPQVRPVIPTAGGVHTFLLRAPHDWRTQVMWGMRWNRKIKADELWNQWQKEEAEGPERKSPFSWVNSEPTQKWL